MAIIYARYYPEQPGTLSWAKMAYADHYSIADMMAERDTGFAVMLRLAESIPAPLTKVRERWAATPNLSDPAWHDANLPDGWDWVPRYWPALRSTDSGGNLAICNEPMACPHCALRAAADARGPGQFAAIISAGNTALPRNYFPPCGELIGEPVPTDTSVFADLIEFSERSCGNCGMTGHNSRTCEAPAKAHDRIGIEIEGRWRDLNDQIDMACVDGLSHCSDGSVHNSSTARGHEFQTKPGTLAEVLRMLVKHYPDETDYSCGMHVHVSFKDPTLVTLLATPEFYAYFKRRWETWGREQNLAPNGEFFARLSGQNDYCHPNNHTNDENITSIDRYHQLNFSAWNEHRTVECRLLPMFRRVSLGVKAVQNLISIFEDWLAAPGLSMPETEIAPESVEGAQVASSRAVFEVDSNALERVCFSTEGFVEVSEPPPPIPGTVRIAIPRNSQAMDYLRSRIPRRVA